MDLTTIIVLSIVGLILVFVLACVCSRWCKQCCDQCALNRYMSVANENERKVTDQDRRIRMIATRMEDGDNFMDECDYRLDTIQHAINTGQTSLRGSLSSSVGLAESTEYTTASSTL